MSVPQADPRAAALDDAFAAAMGAQPKPKEPPAPPVVDRDAPHGRDDAGTPLAPYGHTQDGRPKLSPAGRKPKNRDETPRLGKDTGDTPAATTGGGAPTGGTVLPAKDYTESLMGAADGTWLLLTMGAKLPLSKLPLIPADISIKIAAEATLLQEHAPLLAQGLNIAAAHSAAARRLAERLDTGDMTWALTCGSLIVPFLLQSAALFSGQVDAQLVREYADRNKADLAKFTEKIKLHIAQAQMAAAAAAAAGQGTAAAAAPGPGPAPPAAPPGTREAA